MEIKELSVDGYERIIETNLTDDVKAIISVHNTKEALRSVAAAFILTTLAKKL